MASYVSKKVRLEQARAEKARLVLNNHNKEYSGKLKKKLDYEQILKKASNIGKLREFWIRDPEEWSAKSFNLDRQIVDFTSWVLCEYQVPLFMYRLFLPSRTKRGMWASSRPALEEIYLDWFITVGQGMSFRKACKGFLSKKEAHLFLTAPKNNTIAGNVLWAKCKAQDTSYAVIHTLCSNWERRFNSESKDRWDKIINFYAKYPEIEKDTVQDTMDFIYAAFAEDRDFSLSGRTLNSVIQLTNEWHNNLQLKRGAGHTTWAGLEVPPWKWEKKENIGIWRISQILDSKRLFHEGKVMKHCVVSYSSSCTSGRSGIFTVEHEYCGNKNKCLTVEVNSYFNIVQARGKCNRMASKEEINVLRRWAVDRQLSYNR